jgi:hypothetical protein
MVGGLMKYVECAGWMEKGRTGCRSEERLVQGCEPFDRFRSSLAVFVARSIAVSRKMAGGLAARAAVGKLKK